MIRDNFWKVFLFIFFINRLIWWIGGVDIFDRGVDNAVAIVFSLIISYALISILLVVEMDKL